MNKVRSLLGYLSQEETVSNNYSETTWEYEMHCDNTVAIYTSSLKQNNIIGWNEIILCDS